MSSSRGSIQGSPIYVWGMYLGILPEQGVLSLSDGQNCCRLSADRLVLISYTLRSISSHFVKSIILLVKVLRYYCIFKISSKTCFNGVKTWLMLVHAQLHLGATIFYFVHRADCRYIHASFRMRVCCVDNTLLNRAVI